MSEPRFTVQLTLSDKFGEARPIHLAIDVDEAMRISTRAVSEMKLGLAGSMGATVQLMKKREFRRDVLVRLAEQLAKQMADLMEDAEGWHDESRAEPGRKLLGGSWGQ